MAAPVTEGTADGFSVWSVNWPSLVAFISAETQWRIAATMDRVIWLGLDYSAVDVVLRRLRSPDHVFGDLLEMERAANAVFAEARDG